MKIYLTNLFKRLQRKAQNPNNNNRFASHADSHFHQLPVGID